MTLFCHMFQQFEIAIAARILVKTFAFCGFSAAQKICVHPYLAMLKNRKFPTFASLRLCAKFAMSCNRKN
jgi:hypothetical protein